MSAQSASAKGIARPVEPFRCPAPAVPAPVVGRRLPERPSPRRAGRPARPVTRAGTPDRSRPPVPFPRAPGAVRPGPPVPGARGIPGAARFRGARHGPQRAERGRAPGRRSAAPVPFRPGLQPGPTARWVPDPMAGRLVGGRAWRRLPGPGRPAAAGTADGSAASARRAGRAPRRARRWPGRGAGKKEEQPWPASARTARTAWTRSSPS